MKVYPLNLESQNQAKNIPVARPIGPGGHDRHMIGHPTNKKRLYIYIDI